MGALVWATSCQPDNKTKETAGTYCYTYPDSTGHTYLILNEDGTCQQYAEWLDTLENSRVEVWLNKGEWELAKDGTISAKIDVQTLPVGTVEYTLAVSGDTLKVTESDNNLVFIKTTQEIPTNPNDTTIVTPLDTLPAEN